MSEIKTLQRPRVSAVELNVTPLNMSDPLNAPLSSEALFSATLAHLQTRASSQSAHATPTLEASQDLSAQLGETLCWLLPMARQLGLTSARALELAAPYPQLASLLERVNDELSAASDAERADLQDQIERAVSSYQQHLSLHPYDQERRLKLGRLLIEYGHLEQAQQLCQEGLTLHQGHCVLALRAELLMTEMRFDEAYQVASEAWELAPVHAEVLVTFAETLKWMLNHDDERDLLERALQLHQQHPLALARSFEAEDPSYPPLLRLTEARAAFIRRPTRHIHRALVYAALKAERFEMALKEAQRLMRRDPHGLPSKLAFAYTLNACGHIREARALTLELLKRTPSCPRALSLLVALDATLSGGEDPHEELACEGAQALHGEGALRALQANAHRSLAVKLLYAHALSAIRQEDEAHALYQELYNLFPKRSATLFAYVKSRLQRGELEGLEALCQTRLALFPSDVEVKALLGELSWMRGDSASLEALLEHLTHHPRAALFELRLLVERQVSPERRFERALELLRERPAHPELIERALEALFSTEALSEGFGRLASQTPLERLEPQQLTLFAHLHLSLQEPERAAHALELLRGRPLREVHLERLSLACAAAQTLHDGTTLEWLSAEALNRFRREGEVSAQGERGSSADEPKELDHELNDQLMRFSLYHAVALWRLGEHEDAIETLSAVSQRELEAQEPALAHDVLATLIVWLCESQRHAEARAPLQQLNALESYQRELQQSGLDLLRARVELASEAPHERAAADETLHVWLEMVERGTQTGELEAEALTRAYTRVCQWWLMAERLDEIQALLEPLLPSLAPGHELWSLLAQAYQGLGQTEGALYAFERLTEDEGGDELSLLTLADLLEQQGRQHEALNTYELAQLRYPDSFDVRLERALASLRFKKIDDSAAELPSLLELAREEEALYEREGRLSELELRRGLAEHLKPTLSALGSRDHQPPLEPLPASSSSERGPLSDHVLFSWLSQLFMHAPLDEAERHTARLTAALGSGGYLSGFSGLALLWGGQTSRALEGLFEGCCHDIYFAFEYARALKELGDLELAVHVLRACVLTSPEEPEYLSALIEGLLELNDPYGAYEHLLTLTALAPESAEGLSERVYQALSSH